MNHWHSTKQQTCFILMSYHHDPGPFSHLQQNQPHLRVDRVTLE